MPCFLRGYEPCLPLTARDATHLQNPLPPYHLRKPAEMAAVPPSSPPSPLPPLSSLFNFPGTPAQTPPPPNIPTASLRSLPKPADIPKHFDGPSINDLTCSEDYKMWRFRIHSCIAAVGCEFLLESDPVTAAEKEVAQVIWACIIKFIPNPIMANYLDLEHSIP